MTNTVPAKELTADDKFELVGLIGTWLRDNGYGFHDVSEARIGFGNRVDDNSLFAHVTVKLGSEYTFPVFDISKQEQEFIITYRPD